MVTMKAITFREYGSASVLEVRDIQKPELNDSEVLIKVAGAGINRPDILQRSGFYPPPKGASKILGLEVSGTVVEIGANLDNDVIAVANEGGIYTYSWSIDGNPITQLTKEISIDSGGTYTVTATDNLSGCETVQTIVVNESEFPLFELDDLAVFDLT